MGRGVVVIEVLLSLVLGPVEEFLHDGQCCEGYEEEDEDEC